jgi:hypothetical protein
MKLMTDILPRALWNSCEEILRFERVTSILLKILLANCQLQLVMAFCQVNGK